MEKAGLVLIIRKESKISAGCRKLFLAISLIFLLFFRKTPENVFANLLRKLEEDFLGGAFMTNEQKKMIEEYRRKGVGYKQIAKERGLSPNSVKSFCRRNHLSNEDLKQNESESFCEQCGNPV